MEKKQAPAKISPLLLSKAISVAHHRAFLQSSLLVISPNAQSDPHAVARS
jgi:hypothetical protein